MKVTGIVNLSDVEKPEKIEKLIKAELSGKNPKITWNHDSRNNTSRFTIDSISKRKETRTLNITWNGEPIASKIEGEKAVLIPKIGEFKVLDVKAIQDPEQYVLVRFSEPVAVAQDLTGLIGISTQGDLKYTIEGSKVKIYAPERLEGSYSIAVNEGIENINNDKLASSVSANVVFEDRRPLVTIPGKGIILPGSGKLTFPFEAVNLSAVDVTIVKIYESNIPQYLQTNGTDGNQDLRRVAKPVVQKTIRLDDKSVNLRKKNRFSLDMDKLLRAEPGAIYRITIGFRKSYSIYNCQTGSLTTSRSSGSDDYEGEEYYSEKIDEDDDFWERYNGSYPIDYKWDEKDDPCSDSYYTGERWASRNVLASNIGLIAKRGEAGNIMIAATDILTTEPISGVEIKLLDYQQQVLQTLTTGSDGLITVDLKRKPFLLLAKKGEQRGYLKLDDGSSLPLSRFNINGDVVQSGIKGFIYGERGVWRPGDSIFVSFILDDKANKLPEGHPVSFEFFNPQNQLYKKLTETKSSNGFYAFKTATGGGSPTGNWTVKVRAGGAMFQKSLKIETIMPNRLKINLDFNGEKELVKGLSSTGTLSAKWLFGAAAQNMNASITATIFSGNTKFKEFPDYFFDDPTGSFEAENQVLFNGNLNESGTAPVNADIDASGIAPGVLQANFTTKVFEPAGNFSIDNFQVPYHVFPAYVGIKLPEGNKLSGMLLTDRNHAVSIVNVNTNGELLKGRQKVRVELYKIQWRWWWDSEQENLSNFTQDKYNQLIRKEIVTLNNGSGKWNLRINYPEWGRYLIRVKDLENGHTTGQTVYIDWPGWAQREQQNSPTEASMLSFTANKEKVRVGEEVTLTIPSSKGGRGLVNIETGSKILKTFWIKTGAGQTKFRFEADKEMSPNVYINVTLLQPHAQTKNDLPIRMYGVIPLDVEDPETILKPVINMPEVLKPETESQITVSESSGKAMTYTIAIVDEGLLDLTRFKTPDPHTSFYAREALGVKTWDLFDHVIGAWGGDLERILSIGGDAGINRNINPAKSNRFKPVVKFLGPFSIAKGEHKTHKFKLPPYIGSVRAMVIGGQEGAYGFAEKTVEVKKPLMLLATIPRVAGPGETFKLPITVFALDSKVRNVSLKIQTDKLIELSNGNQNLTFTAQGEKTVFADLKIKDATGLSKISIIASSGTEKAVYNIRLDIRNPNPYITSVTGTELSAGKSWTSSVAPIGSSGTNSAVIEVSSIPPVNLTKRLNYLIQYPHGCVEQITSSAFPQLFLNQLTDLSDQQKAATDRNIKAAINRLRGFQAPGGGLSYWPGYPEGDDWGTNYAGHFILTASAKGYSIPLGFIEQWKRFQKDKANNWVPNSENFSGGDLSQAYRLYLLALAKSPEIGAMNRLREFKYLSKEAKWRLAAAYKLVGQSEIASSMIRNLNYEVKPYRQLGGTFGSDLRDRAMILETLVDIGDKAKASKLLYSVAAQLAKDEWYSTQTTAYALIAISKYLGENKGTAKLNFSYSMNNVKKAVSTTAVLSRIPGNLNRGALTILYTNQGTNKLFITTTIQGQAPAGQNPAFTNDPDVLQLSVSYKTLAGKALNPAQLSQGTDFIAEVKIKNPGLRGFYEQMALTQIFPSGWEIINTRLSDNDAAIKLSPYTYRDIRDDRVLTYFNIRETETLTYQVLLNASYIGRYYLPNINCTAMYDNTIQANEAGKWVEVVKR